MITNILNLVVGRELRYRIVVQNAINTEGGTLEHRMQNRMKLNVVQIQFCKTVTSFG